MSRPTRRPTSACPCARSRSASPAEPKVRVYDTTGPYTDAGVAIDVRKGLARTRRAWVLARGGVEEYDGRPIQPIDNGNVKAAALLPFPNTPRPLRGLDGQHDHPIRMGAAPASITKEMIYVAERENLGRKAGARARARSGWPTARASARRCPSSSRRSSCATRSRSAAPSSRPTSTTPNSSR